MSNHNFDTADAFDNRRALEKLAAAFSELKPGPTGRFPEGKLTEHDEGEIAFRVGAMSGKVVVDFGAAVHSLGMLPAQARELAASLVESADRIEKEAS